MPPHPRTPASAVLLDKICARFWVFAVPVLPLVSDRRQTGHQRQVGGLAVGCWAGCWL
jgi:hypothetical protein